MPPFPSDNFFPFVKIAILAISHNPLTKADLFSDMRLITKKMQERGIIRLRRSEVEFLRVRTRYQSQRHRRGTFYFQTVLRFYESDEAESPLRYRTIINFQPDASAYFLHNIFLTNQDDRAKAIQEALHEARENYARNELSVVQLLDPEKMQEIITRFIVSVNSIETWAENRNGYPYKRLEGFGRFIINIEEAI
jgi:hypothetical protein